MGSYRIPKDDLKISTKRKKKLGKTYETKKVFCFVILVTGPDRDFM
jgi:hypothetical protein